MESDSELLNFKPLELKDKELFDSYITYGNCNNSEASFANLYMWQSAWNICYAIVGEALILSMDNESYRFFLCPPYLKRESESIKPYMDLCVEFMLQKCRDVLIKGATFAIKQKIEKDCPDQYNFIYDEYNSEYVYLVKDLIELSGKKYHSKKNHINTFLKNYTPVIEEYDPKYKEECLELQRHWAKEKDMDAKEANEEEQSIIRALNHYKTLGLKGCVVLIDGKVAAFSFGELICPETVLIHIEKASSEYKGLFPYINREFLANFWSDCEFVNREEDMGIPGIRQAKRSYKPIFMIDKYDIIPK